MQDMLPAIRIRWRGDQFHDGGNPQGPTFRHGTAPKGERTSHARSLYALCDICLIFVVLLLLGPLSDIHKNTLSITSFCFGHTCCAQSVCFDFLPALLFVLRAQMAMLALSSKLASLRFPEKRAWAAFARTVQSRAL